MPSVRDKVFSETMRGGDSMMDAISLFAGLSMVEAALFNLRPGLDRIIDLSELETQILNTKIVLDSEAEDGGNPS
jgi:hypothetical protein